MEIKDTDRIFDDSVAHYGSMIGLFGYNGLPEIFKVDNGLYAFHFENDPHSYRIILKQEHLESYIKELQVLAGLER